MVSYFLKAVYEFIDTFTEFKVIPLNSEAIIPQKADYGCAGYDVYSTSSVLIAPGVRKLVPLGIKVEIPRNHYLRVAPRSGMSLRGIDIGAGVIDSSYRGELMVLLINNSNSDYQVDVGTKIAQLVLERCSNAKIQITDALSESERGYAGFGSTGH